MRLKTPREHFPRSEARVSWLGPGGETSGASSEWHVHQLLSEAACPAVLIPRSLCKSLSLPGLGFPPEWLIGQIDPDKGGGGQTHKGPDSVPDPCDASGHGNYSYYISKEEFVAQKG